MTGFLYVACGGALGAMLRYGVYLLTIQYLSPYVAGSSFPLATLLVNIIGSFAIAVLVFGSHETFSLSEPMKLLLVVGVLGGFTTFSAFSLETLHLVLNNQWFLSSLYVVLSVIGSLAAVWTGYMVMRLIGTV